ncbi:GntR family transcriptional regulator [Streptosporangium sp. NBC_01810]|uniref:GntR family transcriptional regulator n=1 Tax=Streptosporangium sp. NBC_01810 TaxID=2975951 RepID=UPI002DD920C9|nr:GntR family transcriptional regulator [Streptosporangium sp. NBC_01810]WSA23641.1 GntR family transcriptional regulator [Streptosporangium sp. NBC_01810]
MIVIDKPSPDALYQWLASLLRDAIERGEYGPGEKLPSEGRLGQIYDLGRDTVRDALSVLRNEGLVVTQRGSGTRVRSDWKIRIMTLPAGAHVTSRMPTPQERSQWDLPPGVPVFVVEHPEGEPEVIPSDRVRLAVPSDIYPEAEGT